jgi:GT2 family glycosyltransferase
MSIAVSVVVPTYRRQDMLRRCLTALLQQDLDRSRYEVIVADDAAEPATRALVEQFQHEAGPPVRYLAVTGNHGPAAARNAGWRSSGAEVVAFTDDDCVPDSSWLQAGLGALERAGAAAAAGRVTVPLPEMPTDYERDAAGLAHGEFVTANCFCRRDVLLAIGGFDERFTTAWREDSDLQFTLLEQGYAIVPARDAVVVHPVRPARWGVSLRQQRKTALNALLYKKHPVLFRERIPGVPWDYYASCGSLVAASVGLASGWLSFALAGALLWGLLTGRFCAVRLRGASRAPAHVAEMVVTSALIPPLSLYWHACGLYRQRVLFR